MRTKIILSLVFLILIIQTISAMPTPITIKTAPHHEIQLVAFETTADESLIERFTGNSDRWGDLKFNFSFSQSAYSLKIFIKKDNKNVMPFQTYSNYITGEEVFLELVPTGTTLIYAPNNPLPGTEPMTIEETPIETEELPDLTQSPPEGPALAAPTGTENTEDKKSFLTGLSIFGEEGFLKMKTIYYIIGIAFLGLMIAGGFIYGKQKSSKPKKIVVKKLSEVQKEEKEKKIEEKNENLVSAEKRLKELENEIRKLREDDELDKVHKKIEEDEKRLDELRNKKKELKEDVQDAKEEVKEESNKED